MINSLLPPGFKDEISDLAGIEHKYKNTIINLFQINSYKLVKSPLIEFSNNFNSSNALKIKVKKNYQKMILRDDITMQIARIATGRLQKKVRPLKLCYYGEVVRDKGSIIRPERQFLQIGAECIGESSYLADVEIIELALSSLESVGIKNISIELSSRLFLDKLYKNIKNQLNLKKIKLLIRKKDINNSLNLIDKKYHEYLKNIFLCIGNFKDKKQYLENLKIDNSNILEIDKLNNIYKKLVLKFPKNNFFLDLTEFDDKNYHKSTRFTFFSKNIRGEIARGGRYTARNGNIAEEATGFTCYMDTILRASSYKEKIKKILVSYKISKVKKMELLKKDYIVETYFGDLDNIKKIALKKNIKYYLKGDKIYNSVK